MTLPAPLDELFTIYVTMRDGEEYGYRNVFDFKTDSNGDLSLYVELDPDTTRVRTIAVFSRGTWIAMRSELQDAEGNAIPNEQEINR